MSSSVRWCSWRASGVLDLTLVTYHALGYFYQTSLKMWENNQAMLERLPRMDAICRLDKLQKLH